MVMDHGLCLAWAVINLHSVLGQASGYGFKSFFGFGLEGCMGLGKNDNHEIVKEASNREGAKGGGVLCVERGGIPCWNDGP